MTSLNLKGVQASIHRVEASAVLGLVGGRALQVDGLRLRAGPRTKLVGERGRSPSLRMRQKQSEREGWRDVRKEEQEAGKVRLCEIFCSDWSLHWGCESLIVGKACVSRCVVRLRLAGACDLQSGEAGAQDLQKS